MTMSPLKRSLKDFRRHPWLHLVSVATVTLALLILGSFLLFTRNIEEIAERTSPEITGTVYLRDGMSEGSIEGARARILALDGVSAAVFKSRAKVVADLEGILGGASSGSLRDAELFPDVFEVGLKAGSSPIVIKAVSDAMKSFAEVADVDFSDDWLAHYRRLRRGLEIVGWVLLIGLLVGCSFIIANFMGMRHQSRRAEIDVVRLMGGSNGYVFRPFLWEGILEGVLGSGVALCILYMGTSLLATVVKVSWGGLLGDRAWTFLTAPQASLLFAVGVAMAVAGSLTVFLRFHSESAR